MKLMPYIMPTRNDACNWFRGQAEAENIDKYVQEKRQNGMPNFTQMHVILAAYTRLVSQRPALNRFIRGQRVWTKKHVDVSLTIKKEMLLESPDTVVKIRIHQVRSLFLIFQQYPPEAESYLWAKIFLHIL